MNLKFIKYNGGFTLIELLVTLAASVIVMGGICAVLLLGNNLVNNTESKFNEHSEALALENSIIKSQVGYASNVTIYSNASLINSPIQANQPVESECLYFGTYQPSNISTSTPAVYSSDSTVYDNSQTGLATKASNTEAPLFFMKGDFSYYKASVSFSSAAGGKALAVTVKVWRSAADVYTLTQTIPLADIGTNGSVKDNTGGSGGTLLGFTPWVLSSTSIRSHELQVFYKIYYRDLIFSAVKNYGTDFRGLRYQPGL